MISQRYWANYITFARILGVGLIFWMTPFQFRSVQIITILIYTIVSLTDLLDGWVARKLKTESDFGKILDPLADKILVLVFLPLLEMQVITSFPVFVILAREFAVMAFRVAMAKNGLIVEAKFSGKLKTFVTLPVCGILLGMVPTTISSPIDPILLPLNFAIEWVQSWPSWFILFLIWGMVMITVWSFFDYLKEFLYVYSGGDKKKGIGLDLARQNMIKLLPNLITVSNLVLGLFAIYYAIFGRINLAILLVFLGIYLDGYDGKLARKLNVNSSFGALLDSRADYVTFGVAPAIMIFIFMNQYLNSLTWLATGVAMIYYLSVHYRLYRFNKQERTDFFQGLPSPAGAVTVIFMVFSPFFESETLFVLSVLLTSFVMVSRLPYPHVSIVFSFHLYKWLKPLALIFGNCAILMLFLEKGVFMALSNSIFLGIVLLYILYPIFDRAGLLTPKT